MIEKDRITRNIIITVTIFLFVQTVFFSFIVFYYSVFNRVAAVFYLITILFHITLAIFLVRMKKYFMLLETGRQLQRINLANLLTMTRLSLLPAICFLLFISKDYPVVPVLLVITVIAFLTDLLDGALSRRTHQITEIGKYLDSISDYCVLIVISIAFFLFKLLPEWFFLLIMFRLFFQAIAMAVLLIRYGIKGEATLLGKAAVFTTMTLYALEIFTILNIPIPAMPLIIHIAEYIVGVVLFISLFDKLHFLVKKIDESKSSPEANDRSQET